MDLSIKLHYRARKHDHHQPHVSFMPRHWISTEDITDNETLWNWQNTIGDRISIEIKTSGISFVSVTNWFGSFANKWHQSK